MLTASTRRRLADLIPRLSTDHNGERLATVAAIVRVLESNGADLYTLAAIIAGDPLETGATEHPERDAWPEWRQDAETAIVSGLARDQRERDFLNALRSWAGDPTPKQLKWLRDILGRAK
jgi:hypothetical protein